MFFSAVLKPKRRLSGFLISSNPAANALGVFGTLYFVKFLDALTEAFFPRCDIEILNSSDCG